MMNGTQLVSMAEVKICRASTDILMALGLGSCVGLCAYDAQARIAGMAHIVLPSSAGALGGGPGKFADTAVMLMLDEMQREGACATRIVMALAGGAQLFAGNGIGRGLDIGPRNAAAVQAELTRLNLCVAASDLGGTTGRTLHLLGSGLVRVKTIGQGERPLVDLSRLSPGSFAGQGLAPGFSAPAFPGGGATALYSAGGG